LNPQALSPRLQKLYDLCQPKQPVWDLCCDHGLLGLWALHSETHPCVVFNDAVAHVLEGLQQKFGAHAPRAKVICGPAEDIVEPLDGNVVLAGIGGEKIVRILQTHAARANLHATRVIACPEKDAEWMMAQPIAGYAIRDRLTIPHGTGHRWIAVYEPLRQAPKNDSP